MLLKFVSNPNHEILSQGTGEIGGYEYDWKLGAHAEDVQQPVRCQWRSLQLLAAAIAHHLHPGRCRLRLVSPDHQRSWTDRNCAEHPAKIPHARV